MVLIRPLPTWRKSRAEGRMSWLYLPPETLPEPQARACTACRSAPELAGSTSASPLPAPGTALFVTSSAKPMLRPPSWRGWKTRPWIKHLCGTTLPVSMAALGVEQWVSSRAGTPVNAFSVAGKRKGVDDPRHLWPHFARIIGECQNDWTFLRNVADHVSIGNNRATSLALICVNGFRGVCS